MLIPNRQYPPRAWWLHRVAKLAIGWSRKESVTLASFFERFRLLLWALAAAVIGFYIYGLILGLYGPLELGLLSGGY